MAKKEERFIKIYTQNTFGSSIEVWMDMTTGVNYLYHGSGYGGGLTPLLNRDGTPVITPIPNQYDE